MTLENKRDFKIMVYLTASASVELDFSFVAVAKTLALRNVFLKISATEPLVMGVAILAFWV